MKFIENIADDVKWQMIDDYENFFNGKEELADGVLRRKAEEYFKNTAYVDSVEVAMEKLANACYRYFSQRYRESKLSWNR